MTSNRRLRQRVTLLGVFAIFMAPILFALALNLPGVIWRPFGARNHGELLQPPTLLAGVALRAVDGGSLDADPLSGGWTVLLSASAPCDDACRSTIDQLHRVRVSLGEHAGRVQLLWLVAGSGVLEPGPVAELRGRYPALRITRSGMAQLPAPLDGSDAAASVYVVDPRGYLILRYPPGYDASGLRKDLERLLRYSKPA